MTSVDILCDPMTARTPRRCSPRPWLRPGPAADHVLRRPSRRAGELSVVTFANWVAKTANLLPRRRGRPAGRGRLRPTCPLHWQGAVWHAGLPGRAGSVTVPRDREARAESLSRLRRRHRGRARHCRGPRRRRCVAPTTPATRAGRYVGLGLGPMGLPRRGTNACRTRDAGLRPRDPRHGDLFRRRAAGPGRRGAGRRVRDCTSGAELAPPARRPRRWRSPAGRACCRCCRSTSCPAIVAGLLGPLATGAGAVLCRHTDPERLAGDVEAEQVAAVAGTAWRQVPAWRPASSGMT